MGHGSADYSSLLYLLGRFWAEIEIIRRDGISVKMSKDARGRKLQHFFDCLESRRVRIVDRIVQRAIGEWFLKDAGCLNFLEFAQKFEAGEPAAAWFQPLTHYLSRLQHTSERQQLLQYGIVIHAMIDTLDANHVVTRKRPSWPGKLTITSWRAMNYRVFGVYLTMVQDREKYIGKPKRRSRNGKGNPKRL